MGNRDDKDARKLGERAAKSGLTRRERSEEIKDHNFDKTEEEAYKKGYRDRRKESHEYWKDHDRHREDRHWGDRHWGGSSYHNAQHNNPQAPFAFNSEATAINSIRDLLISAIHNNNPDQFSSLGQAYAERRSHYLHNGGDTDRVEATNHSRLEYEVSNAITRASRSSNEPMLNALTSLSHNINPKRYQQEENITVNVINGNMGTPAGQMLHAHGVTYENQNTAPATEQEREEARLGQIASINNLVENKMMSPQDAQVFINSINRDSINRDSINRDSINSVSPPSTPVVSGAKGKIER